MKPELRVFGDAAEAARAGAELFAAAAKEAVSERGSFRVALSGGSTPKAVYFLLSQEAYRGLPWKDMDFFFGDERLVPGAHADSNYRAARDLLLSKVGAVGDRVYPMPVDGQPEDCAKRYEATMRRVFAGAAWPRFDLAFLGLGKDGHTASLFPGGKAVAEKTAWVSAAYAPAEQLRSRLTLTPPVFQAARQAVFIVLGADKSERLRELVEEDFPPEKMPAKAVTPTDGKLIILADQPAASRLH